jgi:hypothetical protein
VAGVEAERHAAAVQHPVDLVRTLDDGAHVRVQRGADAAVGGGGREPVEVAEQRGPRGGVEDRALVVAVEAGRGGEHEGPGARGDEAVERPLHLRLGVVPRVVQHHRDEAADGRQPVRRQRAHLLGRVRREEAVGAELGRGQADPAHLGEHAGGRELVAPAGHLADAPRDGGAGDALEQTAHRRTSSRRTGRCSCRERSQASAM